MRERGREGERGGERERASDSSQLDSADSFKYYLQLGFSVWGRTDELFFGLFFCISNSSNGVSSSFLGAFFLDFSFSSPFSFFI